MEKIMSLSERHQKILELLKVNGIVSVNSLSRQLNVSSVTIRKDLGLLEEKEITISFTRRSYSDRSLYSQPACAGKRKTVSGRKEKDWYEGCRNADSQ